MNHENIQLIQKKAEKENRVNKNTDTTSSKPPAGLIRTRFPLSLMQYWGVFNQHPMFCGLFLKVPRPQQVGGGSTSLLFQPLAHSHRE